RPPLPGGSVARARENSGHDKPSRSRTCSRASEPFWKQVRPMKAPVGAPNTWPVPDASTSGVAVGANTVSLVPWEIASRPSVTRPVPIRLLGLSPVHATTEAAGKPYRLCQYGASVPTRDHGATI